MRSLLLALFGGLIAAGGLLAAQWMAPGRVATQAPAEIDDKAAIGRVVRDYILANPEVLVEAMQELEKKQDTQRDSVAQRAIKTYEAELLRDSDSPVVGNPNADVTIVEFMDGDIAAWCAWHGFTVSLGDMKPEPLAGAMKRVAELYSKIGRHDRLPAPVTSSPGFLANRALTPYILEAMVKHDEGNQKQTIDKAAEDFGMPVGPIELADQVGLDICLHVAEMLKSSNPDLPDPPQWLKDKVAKSELGKKTGKGLYHWKDHHAVKPQGATALPPEMTDRRFYRC